MKPFSGTGFSKDVLVLTPASPATASPTILVTPVRQKLNAALAATNSHLSALKGGR